MERPPLHVLQGCRAGSTLRKRSSTCGCWKSGAYELAEANREASSPAARPPGWPGAVALVYLVAHGQLGAVKVGVSDPGGARVAQHRRAGWHLVAAFRVAGGAAVAIEADVLGWWRTGLGLPSYLRSDQMPQGGWTETVASARIDLAATVARLCELARAPNVVDREPVLRPSVQSIGLSHSQHPMARLDRSVTAVMERAVADVLYAAGFTVVLRPGVPNSDPEKGRDPEVIVTASPTSGPGRTADCAAPGVPFTVRQPRPLCRTSLSPDALRFVAGDGR